MSELRARFPGLAGEWARFDGPAGTQVVDTAIEATAIWQRSGNNANSHGPFAAADACDELVVAARSAMGSLLNTDPAGVFFGPAHDVGARVVVDGVHLTPHRRVDVEAIGCDVNSTSSTHDTAERTPTVSFLIEGLTSESVARDLADARIAVWNGHNYAIELMRAWGLADQGAVRAGVVAYTDDDDVARLVAAVDRIASSR